MQEVNDQLNNVATDSELQEIRDRLDQLGFSEGTFVVSGVSSSSITTNKIVKQGKYAIGTLGMNLSNQNISQLSITVPREFMPKSTKTLTLCYSTNTNNPKDPTDFFIFTTMERWIDLTEFRKLSNVTNLHIVNLGWEIE